jgi:hypothetical protein
MSSVEFESASRKMQRSLSPCFSLLGHFDKHDQLNNDGTATFVRIGDRKLIVTNWHVVSDYYTTPRPTDLKLGLMGKGTRFATYDLSPCELLSADPELDLAVLSFGEHIAEDGIEFINYKTFRRDVSVNDDVCVIGYPGKRIRPEPLTLHYAPLQPARIHRCETCLVVGKAIHVNDRRIYMTTLDEERQLLQHSCYPISDLEWGGMSGGPAFVRVDDTYRPLGFLYEASGGLNGIFKIVPAHFIDGSGRITPLREVNLTKQVTAMRMPCDLQKGLVVRRSRVEAVG